jgi:hypothetical protein
VSAQPKPISQVVKDFEQSLHDGVKLRNEKTVGVRQRHSLGSRNTSTSFPNWTARLKSR